mgnify:CR=1 FL=1
MNTDEEDKTPAESSAVEPAQQEKPGRRRKGRRILLAVLCVLVVLIGAGCVTWYSLMRVAPASSPDAYVDIRAGDAVSDISARLHAMGMTTNDRSLGWYWRLKGGGSLREGRYVVGGAASMADLYQILAVGQPLTVRVTFPEGYHAAHLAGKAAVFACTVKAVNAPKPAEIDDELAKKFGAESLDALKAQVAERLESEYKGAARAVMKRALLDQLPSLAQQHALVTGVSTGVPVAVRVRDVDDPPKSDDPDFISTWAAAEKLSALADHIDRVVEDWQGDAPAS